MLHGARCVPGGVCQDTGAVCRVRCEECGRGLRVQVPQARSARVYVYVYCTRVPHALADLVG